MAKGRVVVFESYWLARDFFMQSSASKTASCPEFISFLPCLFFAYSPKRKTFISNILRRHYKKFGFCFTFKTFKTLKRKPCIAADVKEESICGFSSEVLRFKATLRWCFTLLIWQLIAYKITSRYFNGNPHYASEMIWAKGIFHTKSQGKNLVGRSKSSS